MLGGYRPLTEVGFTLLELTVVLGIIALLAVLAFVGQGEIRSKARFTDTVDRTVSLLSSAQGNSNNTFNNGEGKDTGEVFFGTVLHFGGTSTNMALVHTNQLWRQGEACSSSDDLHVKEDSDFEIPGGAVVSEDQAIVFARQCTTGQPITFVPQPGETQLENLSVLTNSQPEAVIKLDDGRSHCAEITVTAPAGNISKEYVDC